MKDPPAHLLQLLDEFEDFLPDIVVHRSVLFLFQKFLKVLDFKNNISIHQSPPEIIWKQV